MSFLKWVRDSQTRIQREGFRSGIQDSSYELYLGALRRLEPLVPAGTNIFNREWDLLVILDSARVDAMAAVENEYAFLNQPGQLRSVGSASYQWMDRTFTDEHIEELSTTGYVTANHFAEEFLDENDLDHLKHVWRYGWDESVQTVPARQVTDAAIRLAREQDNYNRYIVHYMQPHFPSIPDPIVDPKAADGEPFDIQKQVWKKARTGVLDDDRIWDSYMANLRYVLEDVELLLKNVNADQVVISADHANAFGEQGVYAHPNVPLKCLRTVPWYQTTATDEETYQPDDQILNETEKIDMDERLRALGYK